jgi:hypothetical protein
MGTLRGRQKIVIERKAKNSWCNLYRGSSTETTTCFPLAQSLLNGISQLHPPTTRFAS